jgi:hypothetical protein
LEESQLFKLPKMDPRELVVILVDLSARFWYASNRRKAALLKDPNATSAVGEASGSSGSSSSSTITFPIAPKTKPSEVTDFTSFLHTLEVFIETLNTVYPNGRLNVAILSTGSSAPGRRSSDGDGIGDGSSSPDASPPRPPPPPCSVEEDDSMVLFPQLVRHVNFVGVRQKLLRVRIQC